jgi:hypothetical protein
MKLKLISLMTLVVVFSACSLWIKPPLLPKTSLMAAENIRSSSTQRIPGANPLELLKLTQVRSELELDQQQINKLHSLESRFYSKLEPPENPEADQNPVGAYQEKRSYEENQRLITQLLTPKQMDRFKEIVLQVYGWGTITPEELDEILVLTSQQKKEIETIRISLQQQLKTALKIPDSPQKCESTVKANFQQLAAINQNTEIQMKQVLTAKQYKVFNDLRGGNFTLNLDNLAYLCDRG